MTNNEFLYWLWGYFELEENTDKCHTVFDNKQLEMIKSHIDLVMEENAWGLPFLHWLCGALDIYEIIDARHKSNIKLTQEIYARLKKEFNRITQTQAILNSTIIPTVKQKPGLTCVNFDKKYCSNFNAYSPPASC